MGKNFWKQLFGRGAGTPGGFSTGELNFILTRSKIPEHIPPLMEQISQGKGFLVNNYLGFENGEWMILVGYPLEGEFSVTDLESVTLDVLRTFHPRILWLIAPNLPASLAESASLMQADQYFQLDLKTYNVPSRLKREVNKTTSTLTVDISNRFTDSHRRLVSEFIQSQELPPLVAALYQSMPQYLASASTAHLVNAWDVKGELSAFYVVECSAQHFDAYILGCYSRENYVPHASDRLFYEMIEYARQAGKQKLQLGLGVNPGIRKFKEKWGGEAFLEYKAWECRFEPGVHSGMLDWLLEGKW